MSKLEPLSRERAARAVNDVKGAWGLEAASKPPTRHPVDVTREWLAKASPRDFGIALKTDGWLAHVVIRELPSGEWLFGLVNERGEAYKLPVRYILSEAGLGTIFLAEVVGNRILVFDICMVAGASICGHKYEDRCMVLEKELREMELVLKGYTIEVKPWWRRAAPSKCLELCKGLPYRCGLVFTHSGLALAPGPAPEFLVKWKPLSVDLLVIRGKAYVTGDDGTPQAIEVCDVDELPGDIADNTIAEFVFDGGSSDRPRLKYYRVLPDTDTPHSRAALEGLIERVGDSVKPEELDAWWGESSE